MSTNSDITIKNDDGTYTVVYCHWDGDLSYNGVHLFKFYNKEELARELISGGDISAINSSLKETEYYHRDRAEEWEDVAPRTIKVRNERDLNQTGYMYLWRDGQWWTDSNNTDIVPLLDAIMEECPLQIASFLEEDSVT